MGLDIYTTNSHARVGSYSGVHVLRLNMIIASIKYLDQFNNCSNSIDLKEFLKTTISKNNMTLSNQTNAIDYQKFSKYKEYPYSLLEGLFIFTDHSDCDGTFLPDDSSKIIETIELIASFMDDCYFDGSNKTLEKFYLYGILKDSSENNEVIYFS